MVTRQKSPLSLRNTDDLPMTHTHANSLAKYPEVAVLRSNNRHNSRGRCTVCTEAVYSPESEYRAHLSGVKDGRWTCSLIKIMQLL